MRIRNFASPEPAWATWGSQQSQAVGAVNLTNISALSNTTPANTNSTYFLNLTNNGTATDTYTITISNPDNADTAATNITSVTLAAGASRIFTLNVTNATAGTFRVNVTARSNNDSTKFGYINTTTNVTGVAYGVNLTNISALAQTTPAGTNVTYTLSLNNNGTVADSYTLAIDNTNSASTAALNIPSPVFLNAGASKIFNLNVTNATAGTFRVNVTARSNNDSTKFGYINTTTNVTPTRGTSLLNISVLNQSTNAGVNATYVLNLTNNGTGTDTYTLAIDNPDSASTAALNIPSPVFLDAGASKVFNLNVTNATAGTFRVNVTARSNNDSTRFGYINTTTTVTGVAYGVNLTNISALAQTTPAGTNTTYTLSLTNNGTAADSYTLAIDNPNSASTAALNIPSPVFLNAGASKIFNLNVTNATAGTFRVNVTALSNNDSTKFGYINTTTTVTPVVAAAEIHGIKFNDSNGNGIKETGESGVPGVGIQLKRVISPGVEFFAGFTSTDFNGSYWFMGLLPGLHKVEELPSGMSQTFPANGSPHFVNLSAGMIIENIDFGNQPVPPGEIHGRKFNDTNGNGVQDAGESGVPGVTICSWPPGNCTTTNTTGDYWFMNVPAGVQTVYEFLPSGRIATTPQFVTITVNSSEVKIVNFGNRPPVPPPPDVIIGQQFGEQNGVPTVLRPGLTILTIRKNLTNISTNVVAVNLTLNWSDGTSKKASMTEIDATNVWEANFTAPFPPESAQMRFKVDVFPQGPSANDSIQIGDIIFIDPSGTIRDACTGAPISGATATLFVEFPPGLGMYIVSPPAFQIPPDNPLTTGAGGIYSWLTVPGTYRVRAEKAGYVTNQSPNVTVPPEVTGLDISLTPTVGCPVPPPPPSGDVGKVKGEGWIVSPIPPAKKKDNKATFNFEGGNKKGGVKGKFEYHDNAADIKVKGDVTALNIDKTAMTATLSGTATIKIGKTTTLGTYTVMAWDNSKKGKGNDRINITLSTGYTANATLGGGNIKVDP